MSTSKIQLPIIQTKFCVPGLTKDLVNRNRLLDMMNDSLEYPLTLVSAPAGYGKSVLVSQWCHQQEHSTIWLSLDRADADLRQFLSYLIAALDKKIAGACSTTHELIKAPGSVPEAVVVSHLLNDLYELDHTCSIVLDDYHHLDQSSVVHELFERLLDHPSSNVHFVMITRRDPPLRLAQLRALNQLLEIRMQDLRFTQPEVSELLFSATGHKVNDGAVTHLQQEIDGWAVGLRLVSLGMRHSKTPSQFLLSLRGGIPQIQEYLLSEVLSGLPDAVRDCMLKISVLNRFCGDLAESVCNTGKNATAQIDASVPDVVLRLQAQNLFVISLDHQDYWFRYHHLFQELLQRELSTSMAEDEIAEIHMRACLWFETHGYIEEAIEHALKAGDPLFAARIVERHCYQEIEADRNYVVGRWLASIPKDITRQSLTLVLAHTWVAMFGNQLEQVAALTGDAEALLKAEDTHTGLAGEVDFFRGYLLFWEGVTGESMRLLARAQQSIDSHKNMIIAEVDLHLAFAQYVDGEGKLAIQTVNEQIAKFRDVQLARRIAALAFIRMLSADLPAFVVDIQRMRAVDKKMRSVLVDSWTFYFEGCADIHWFNPEKALIGFSMVVEKPHIVDVRPAIDAFAGLALTQQFLGQPDKATETIEKLRVFVSETGDPANQILANSCQARIDLLQGNTESAMNWANSYKDTPGLFDLFLWLEVPAITRIRILAETGSPGSLEKALELINEIRTISENYHLTIQLIEVAVLETIIMEKQGNRDQALKSLRHAVDMAESGGWIRPFIEAGPAMAELLKGLLEQDGKRDYISRLLQKYPTVTGEFKTPVQVIGTESKALAAFNGDGMTNRELDILELLAQRMQNKEIANKLIISTHTVKDHLKHIYQKLDTGNRRQAVIKAIKLGVIPPP